MISYRPRQYDVIINSEFNFSLFEICMVPKTAGKRGDPNELLDVQ